MPFTPTVPASATDWDCVLDDARASLVANPTIASTLAIATNPKRIAPRIIAEGVAFPSIVLQFTPTYQSTFSNPMIAGFLDVSCYTTGESTTMVRSLLTAALATLVDTPWIDSAMTAAGVALVSQTREPDTAIRDLDEVIEGRIIRGKQATIRLTAMKLL